jgi:hypothetical protein
MSYFGNIFDAVFNRNVRIDNNNNMLVANTKRIAGSLFGTTLDPALYTTTLANGGTVAVTNSMATLATNTTASGSSKLFFSKKARAQVGKQNIFRAHAGFGDTGVTGNVREFGVYIDANNFFGYRLSGTTFQIVVKKAGTETVYNNGSFSGLATYNVDTNLHIFEIAYSTGTFRFIIDQQLIHTVSATTGTLVVGLAGQLYASNTNTTIATNQNLNITGWSISHYGDAVNNPFYVNDSSNGTQTVTLKAGGGTLQAVWIGSLGGSGATLTIYDSTTGTGTIIQKLDLTAPGAIGVHAIGAEGFNFYNGLTYVTTGSLTNASFTFLFE